MLIVKIQEEENGSHFNQRISGMINTIPTGWAVVPNGITIPSTFPFVNIEVDGSIVTKMEESAEKEDVNV